MRRVLRVIQLFAILVCALPGALFAVVALTSLKSRDPFTTSTARDIWTIVLGADYILMLFASPITIPLMWVLFAHLSSSLPTVSRRCVAVALAWSTLGALLFWLRFFS